MKNTTLLYLPLLVLSSACAQEELRGTTEAFSTRFQVMRAATVDECPNGGVVLEYGIDSNGNGELDETEVYGTDVVCHGADGSNGQDGATGADGSTGPAGAAGVTSLVNLSEEPAGDNCPFGGTRIEQGPDTNANGTLDADEVIQTSYVCHGTNGTDGTDGLNTLIEMQDILSGTDCANGGIRISAGLDADSDGALDEGEISQTEFVCNGEDGTAALTPLFITTPMAESAICPAGGIEFVWGLDLNADGMLTENEVTSTESVCNGVDGINGQDGADGQDGVDGQNGTDGQDGADGQNGTDGQDGADGQDGVDGQNGADGQDGVDGQDAYPNYITSSITCAGSLANTSLYFNYSVAQFALGEVFVSGGIFGDYTSVNSSAMYSPNQVGFATAPLIFVYDALGTANQGFWTLSLTRSSLVTNIEYTDIDGNLTWQMMPENCVVNDYTD